MTLPPLSVVDIRTSFRTSLVAACRSISELCSGFPSFDRSVSVSKSGRDFSVGILGLDFSVRWTAAIVICKLLFRSKPYRLFRRDGRHFREIRPTLLEEC